MPSFRLTSIDCHELEPGPELAEFFRAQDELKELTWHPPWPGLLAQGLFFHDGLLPRLEVLNCSDTVADAWLSRRSIRTLHLHGMPDSLVGRQNICRVEVFYGGNQTLCQSTTPFVNLRRLRYFMPFPCVSICQILLLGRYPLTF